MKLKIFFAALVCIAALAAAPMQSTAQCTDNTDCTEDWLPFTCVIPLSDSDSSCYIAVTGV